MSTSFEEFLNSPSLFAAASSSGSYFPAYEFENDGLKMEETLDFSAQFGNLLGEHFQEAQPVAAPAPSPSEAPLLKTEKAVTPLSFLEEEEEEEGDEMLSSRWEAELEQLISDFDGEVPIDPAIKEELLKASVKEFNRHSKLLKLDAKTIQFLKQKRKRMKNREAAIRSRTRKESRVEDLQRQVDRLNSEKQAQALIIAKLEARTQALERELLKARNPLPPPPPSA